MQNGKILLFIALPGKLVLFFLPISLPYSHWRSYCYSNRLHGCFVNILSCCNDVYGIFFLVQRGSGFFCLKIDFTLTNDLKGLNVRV